MARANLLTRLLVVVAVATMPAILVLLYLQRELNSDAQARVADDVLRQAMLLNADLGGIVEGARQLTLAMIHAKRIERLDPDCRDQLRQVRADAPSYARLAVITADARTICASDDVVGAPSPALASLARQAISQGHFTTGVFVPASDGHVPQLPFAMPFAAADGSRAVMMAALDLDWLTSHLGGFKRPARGIITIADRDGVTLARMPADAAAIGQRSPDAAQNLIDAPSRGNAVVDGRDGLDRLVGYIPIGERPLGLYVSVGYFMPDMMLDIERAAWRGYALIGLGALISLGLTILVAQYSIRRPTRILVAAARRWSSGDMTARVALRERPTTEFGRLAVALNVMADAVDRQRAEARDLNATLEQRVAERTSDLVASRDRLRVERVEHEKTEASLRQAQKLQAIGQLAGGIAHDFNNILTTVTGALEVLRRRLPPEHDPLVQLTDDALKATERGARLTAQLLAFARRQLLLPAPTDLNALLIAVTGMLGSTLGRRVRVTTALAPDLWPAMVDPTQVEAAVLNLALNARDAMADGGVLTIATANVSVRAGTGDAGRVAPGDYVSVRVTDTGSGMSPEILARVFEPYFTTKPPGLGSGLGLSQVHGLAVQSGGDVRIETREGGGTSVTLLVPRASEVPVAPPVASPEDGPIHKYGRARVLVVDDDDDVRAMLGEMLREVGYTVTLVGGGAEALATLERSGGFDLMLADYAMPGMNGVALIEAARVRHPGMRALLVTGFAEFREAEALPAAQIVRKPFTLRVLVERIERALAGAREAAEASPASR